MQGIEINALAYVISLKITLSFSIFGFTSPKYLHINTKGFYWETSNRETFKMYDYITISTIVFTNAVLKSIFKFF